MASFIQEKVALKACSVSQFCQSFSLKSSSVMDAPVPASAPELLSTPPGAQDTLEAEPGLLRQLKQQ